MITMEKQNRMKNIYTCFK